MERVDGLRSALEHPQLDILTMQLCIGLFTALLPAYWRMTASFP